MSNGQSLSVKMSTILLYKYRMTSLHMRSAFDINDMFLELPGSEEGGGVRASQCLFLKDIKF